MPVKGLGVAICSGGKIVGECKPSLRDLDSVVWLASMPRWPITYSGALNDVIIDDALARRDAMAPWAPDDANQADGGQRQPADSTRIKRARLSAIQLLGKIPDSEVSARTGANLQSARKMRTMRGIRPVELPEILRLRREGLAIASISARMGISKCFVDDCIRKYGRSK